MDFYADVQPVHLDPVEQQAVSVGWLYEFIDLKFSRFDRSGEMYSRGSASIVVPLGATNFIFGASRSTLDDLTAARIGLRFALTERLGLSYDHYSSPELSNDGTDIAGIYFTF